MWSKWVRWWKCKGGINKSVREFTVWHQEVACKCPRLFFTVPWVGLQCVIVVFPDHTLLLLFSCSIWEFPVLGKSCRAEYPVYELFANLAKAWSNHVPNLSSHVDVRYQLHMLAHLQTRLLFSLKWRRWACFLWMRWTLDSSKWSTFSC